MELYFLRHAIAVPRGTPGYEDDTLRPLTPEGKKKMEKIALGMKRMKLDFDFILASPYPRGKSTAEIVARTFKLRRKLKLVESLAAVADSQALISYLKSRYAKAESLLLVGHEPFMSELISFLLSGDSRISIDLKKGGLCKLVVEALENGRCATLEWLLAPRQLVLMG